MKHAISVFALLFSASTLFAQLNSSEFDAETVTAENIRQAYDRLSEQWSDMPEFVPQAIVAAEDQRFYNRFSLHSPITTHLARMLLFDAPPEQKRAVHRFRLSVLLSNTLTRAEILNWYARIVFMGQGCKGFQAASPVYFGQELGTLPVAQLAFLAALPRAPLRYHPEKYTENALRRRNFILDEMLRTGVLSEAEAREALAQPLGTQSPLRRCDGS